MIISGAWAIDSYPDHFVLDVPRGGLRLALLTPYRCLTDEDLTPYEGPHPRRMRGAPMPEYLYRHYGLEKSNETASEVLRVRLTPTEKATIEEKAAAADLTLSEYLRQAALGD